MSEKYHFPGDIIKNLDFKELKGTKVMFIFMPVREQAVPNEPPMGIALLASFSSVHSSSSDSSSKPKATTVAFVISSSTVHLVPLILQFIVGFTLMDSFSRVRHHHCN